MKRIMVFDVPAENGGALSVLNDFYNKCKSDLINEYVFVVSTPKLRETYNIKILRFPWIKKSWLHRLYFDYIVAHKLLKHFKIDEVISLQNIIIPNAQLPQRVFIHNALPFSEYRFSISEDKILWIYQNILSKKIFRSIKKANQVIVQTEWMKNKCIEKLKVDVKKIKVIPPKLNIAVTNTFTNTRENYSTFFYPASGALFKNHKVIIDACINLKKKGITNYKVVFTLKGDENNQIMNLYRKVKDNLLPVEFMGEITREEVLQYYLKSILLFPSYVETVGLPLIEAKMHFTPILVSDCLFSYEVLKGYDNCTRFDPFNSEELSLLMEGYILNKEGLIKNIGIKK